MGPDDVLYAYIHVICNLQDSPVKEVLSLSPFYRWLTEAEKWKHPVSLLIVARFSAVPINKTLWEFQGCSALCKALSFRPGPCPPEAHSLEVRGAMQKTGRSCILLQEEKSLWRECPQWHSLARETSLGWFCPEVQCGLSELSKYKRSPSPVCTLMLDS